MALGKLPVLWRPTNLDNSRATAYCACSRCGRRLFGHFFWKKKMFTHLTRIYYLKGSLVLVVGAGWVCGHCFLALAVDAGGACGHFFLPEKMSKQPPPTPTASTIDPFPIIFRICRTARH